MSDRKYLPWSDVPDVFGVSLPPNMVRVSEYNACVRLLREAHAERRYSPIHRIYVRALEMIATHWRAALTRAGKM